MWGKRPTYGILRGKAILNAKRVLVGNYSIVQGSSHVQRHLISPTVSPNSFAWLLESRFTGDENCCVAIKWMMRWEKLYFCFTLIPVHYLSMCSLSSNSFPILPHDFIVSSDRSWLLAELNNVGKVLRNATYTELSNHQIHTTAQYQWCQCLINRVDDWSGGNAVL